jgi:hypothetical protein
VVYLLFKIVKIKYIKFLISLVKQIIKQDNQIQFYQFENGSFENVFIVQPYFVKEIFEISKTVN